jgi:hypothetical protein
MQPFSLYLWMSGGEDSAILTVRLYSSRVSPLINPQVGDFTEAEFPGYQRLPFPASLSTQFLTDETGFVGFPGLYWVLQGPAGVPQDVQGVFYAAVRSDMSEVVLGYQDFPKPRPMRMPGDDILAMLSVSCKPMKIEY